MERGKKGTWATAGKTEVRPREDILKSTSYGTGSQPPRERSVGLYVEPEVHSFALVKQVQTPRRPPSP